VNFLENEPLLMLRIYKLRLIKNLTSLRAFPMRKRVRALKSKYVVLTLPQKLVYSSQDLRLQLCFKYKIGEVSPQSKNAPGLFLEFLTVCRHQASSSLLPRKVLSILPQTCMCSPFAGFVKAPDIRSRILLALPLDLSILLFLSNTF
jgi:hypothetical protein